MDDEDFNGRYFSHCVSVTVLVSSHVRYPTFYMGGGLPWRMITLVSNEPDLVALCAGRFSYGISVMGAKLVSVGLFRDSRSLSPAHVCSWILQLSPTVTLFLLDLQLALMRESWGIERSSAELTLASETPLPTCTD